MPEVKATHDILLSCRRILTTPLDGIVSRAPGIEAAFQRTHPVDAFLFQQERSPGTGNFIRAGAVEHDVAVPRDFEMAMLDFLQGKVDGAWNTVRIELQGEWMPDIDHRDGVSCIQAPFELIHGNLRHAQIPKKFLSKVDLVSDQSRHCADEKQDEQSTGLTRQAGKLFQLIAEQCADSGAHARPDQGSADIV